MSPEHVDVLIVGAGLSGISAANYLQTRCPNKSYLIVESRSAIGGTWDLFRYPGVRSDSDMHTLGYSFRPWQETKTIAAGPAIRTYIRETAEEFGIDHKIRFNQQVQRASWSSEQTLWTVDVKRQSDPEPIQYTCNFLFVCSGYYDYEQGYTPTWPGIERFTGQIVHPQHWPQDLDYRDKRVVVIGSGATAVTLVPVLAEKASQVTMLQRSPTYVLALPAEDTTAQRLHRFLPGRLAYALARWKSILLQMLLFQISRRRPQAAKHWILQQAQEQLGPDYDVNTHFNPPYNPWDQRLCLAPEGDLFQAIKSGRAQVVTGEIETFTEIGIRLCSGQELPADLIVTATGLNLKLMGGVHLSVDGIPVDLSQTLSYKGMMYSDIPNLASTFGYTNASWTLKCELIDQYVCRLLNYMDRHGYDQCTPRPKDVSVSREPILNLTSGYIHRSLDQLPRQGSRQPWKMYQNYFQDLLSLRLTRVNDGTLEFRHRVQNGK